MKTCKDCIHFDICDDFLPPDDCSSFKDASKFIELPSSKSLQEILNNLKPISHEDIEMALKQMETADDIVGCTMKWVIENSKMEEI